MARIEFDINNPVKARNYRDVIVYDANEYYKEIHRAQRGWKMISFAVNDTETPNTCKVFKDGKLVASITVILN